MGWTNMAAALSWSPLLLQLPAKALKHTTRWFGERNQVKEHEQLAAWTQAATETLPHYNCGHVVGPRHKQSVVIAKFACCDIMSNTGNYNGRILQASSSDCILDKAFHTDVDLRKTMQEPG